jgi:hypothetical protein
MKQQKIDPQFIVVKMWDDDEIVGRIYLQLCNLFPEAFLSDQKDKFFTHAFSVMHKLTAIKYHCDNYKRIEKIQFEEAKRKFKKHSSETREAFELIFELEAFLFQVKSSLDMLIKLLIPILGDGVVKTKTYSNKGDDLIKGLTQYKKKKNIHVEMADNLIKLAQDHKNAWLEKTIKLRDELNHIEGLKLYRFEPLKLPNGEITAREPRFKNYNTLEIMNLIYSNNLVFHQDFMVVSLALRAGPAFLLLPEDPQGAERSFNHKYAKYVKWCWGANPSKINNHSVH